MRPIIIGGSGRSGTSFFQKCLGAHSEICSQRRESHLYTSPLGLSALRRKLSSEYTTAVPKSHFDAMEEFIVEGLVRQFPTEVYRAIGLGKIKKRVKRFLKDLIGVAFSSKSTVWGEGERVLLRYHSETAAFEVVRRFVERNVDALIKRVVGKERWIEKTPWNVLYFEEISRLFPEAKLLHMWRTPRDVIDSVRYQKWGPPSLYEAMCWYEGWLRCWMERREAIRALPGYLEIKYEDFVQNPLVWEEVLDFIEVTPSKRPEMSAVHVGRAGSWDMYQRRSFKKRFEEVLGEDFDSLP